MPSFDDLKRINKANSIINRSNLSMGLRPMYLNAEEEEEAFESASLSSKLDRSFRTAKENEIITAEEYYSTSSSLINDSDYEEDLVQEFYQDYHEDDYYYEEEPSQNFERIEYPQNAFFDAAHLNSKPLFESYPAAVAPQQANILPFAKTVMLTSVAVIISIYFIFAFKPVSTATESKQTTEVSKIQELTKVVNSTEPRSLIITSGDFAEKVTAEAYQESLKAKLGVPLKLVKRGASYSVQIGPAYANHDDALIVFDELSRYSVENLSIKIAS